MFRNWNQFMGKLINLEVLVFFWEGFVSEIRILSGWKRQKGSFWSIFAVSWQAGWHQRYFSFAHFFLSSLLSPWKPCGSYATFDSKETLVCGIDGCGTRRVRSRNVTWMQYLKAARRQYSTSVRMKLKPGPFFAFFPILSQSHFSFPFPSLPRRRSTLQCLTLTWKHLLNYLPLPLLLRLVHLIKRLNHRRWIVKVICSWKGYYSPRNSEVMRWFFYECYFPTL